MTDPVTENALRPVITDKGLEAALAASTLGKPAKITHVGLTERPGEANSGMATLPGESLRLKAEDGTPVNPHQVSVSVLLREESPGLSIHGIGFYLDDGTLFAVYQSRTPLLNHTAGTQMLVSMDVVMGNIPAGSITVEATGANLDLGGFVKITRKVNGKALDKDITLTPADINAAAAGFGLGEQQAYTVEDMNSVPTTWNGGGIGWFRGISTTANKPDNRAGVGIANRYQRGDSSGVYIIYFSGHDIYTRYWTGSEWRDWSKSYSTTNKPTADDVGGVPVTRKVNNKALSSDITLDADDVKALSLEKDGVVKGKVTATEFLAGNETIGARLFGSGDFAYLQGGKKDRDEAAQKMIVSGWYGTPLSFYRLHMADNTHPYVRLGATDYRMYHQGNLNLSTLGGVPATRKVNGKALDKDITLNADDVGALKQGDFGLGARQGKALNAADFTEDKTSDFNKLITAGEYSVSGGWLNSINNKGESGTDSLTAIVKVELRHWPAGCCYVQTVKWQTNNTWTSKTRTGTGSYPNITWSPWFYFGPNEAELQYRVCIDRPGETTYPYMTLHKRDVRNDLASGWYTSSAVQFKMGDKTDENNPDSGKAQALLRADRRFDNAQNRVVLQLRKASDAAPSSEVALYENSAGFVCGGKAADWDGKDFKLDGKKVIVDSVLAALFPVGHVIISTNAANPSSYGYPGTWVLTEGDTSLISVSKDAGSISGNNNPVVPLPAHSHSVSGSTSGDGHHNHGQTTYDGWTEGGAVYYPTGRINGTSASGYLYNDGAGSHTHTVTGTAHHAGTDGATIDVRGKCLKVYMWRRTA